MASGVEVDLLSPGINGGHMSRPDLAALVTYWQTALRLADWRLKVSYVRDLANAAGDPVYGLCSRLVDNKSATISIRDPETPAGNSDPSVEEIVIHELSHLLLAPLAGNSPADIAAEEQAVWAFSEAIVKAKGSGAEAQMTRAMLAHVASRSAATPGKKGPTMDPKIVSAAIAAIKSGDGDGALAMLEKMLVAAAGGTAAPDADPDADAAAKPPVPPPAPPADDEKKPVPPPASAKAEPPPAAMRATPDPLVAELAAKVQKFEDERSARIASDIQTERSALASRPGLSPVLAAIVRDEKTPIETARQIAGVAKAGDTLPTRGATQGTERSARLSPEERRVLDERMGVAKVTGAIRREGNAMVFSVAAPDSSEPQRKVA